MTDEEGCLNPYDVLGVSPRASEEVIRAAYRALSQKYHPDRNPNDGDAHAVMAGINEAYAVLSDPQRRREYDLQAARQSLAASVAGRRLPRNPQVSAAPAALPALTDGIALPSGRKGHLPIWMTVFAVVVVGGIIGWTVYIRQHVSADTPMAAQEDIGKAPNGQPYPIKAAYVSGYPVLRENGGNVIRVDASGLNTGVFAQLYELRPDGFTAIRSFFIPAGGMFSLDKIGDGDFSLHYRRSDNGAWQVSDVVSIKNTRPGHYREIDIRL